MRALQEREIVRLGDSSRIPVNVRIIAASNRDLRGMVERNEFRQDLYYRLHVIGLHVPALRERREDIPKLVEVFVRRYAAALDKPRFRLSQPMLDRLVAHDWPGNVRELENAIERLIKFLGRRRHVSRRYAAGSE